jgi:serine/threonine protein kinase
MVVTAGRVIDEKFTVLSLRGAGAFGSVYEAFQNGFDRRVALKILRESNEEMRIRFMREAQILAHLHNKHLPLVYGYGIIDGSPYMAMEWLDGQTLEEIICNNQQLSMQRCSELFKQLCEGLRCAHVNGIVHRDLKPANILVIEGHAQDFVVKLLDFGLAKNLETASTEQQLTRDGSAVGSLHYMSPETCLGARGTAAADVYAVGCLMYLALTTSPPFDAPRAVELMLAHVHKAPPPLVAQDQTPVEIVRLWERLIHHCLSKESSDRPTCDEIIAELNSIDNAMRESNTDGKFAAISSEHLKIQSSEDSAERLGKDKKSRSGSANTNGSKQARALTVALSISVLTILTVLSIKLVVENNAQQAFDTNDATRQQFQQQANNAIITRIQNRFHPSITAALNAREFDKALELQNQFERELRQTGQGFTYVYLIALENRLATLLQWSNGNGDEEASLVLASDVDQYVKKNPHGLERSVMQPYLRIKSIQWALKGNEKTSWECALKGEALSILPLDVFHYWQSYEFDSLNTVRKLQLKRLIFGIMQKRLDTYESLKTKDTDQKDYQSYVHAANLLFWYHLGIDTHQDKAAAKELYFKLMRSNPTGIWRWQLDTMYAKMLAEEGNLEESQKVLDAIKVPRDSMPNDYALSGFIQARSALAKAYEAKSEKLKALDQYDKLMTLLSQQPRIKNKDEITEAWKQDYPWRKQ